MANKPEFWPLPMKILWVFGVVMVVFVIYPEIVEGFEGYNVTEVYEGEKNGWFNRPLMVGLTLIPRAAAKGAVCLDGSLPGYHLHRGYGSGANSWLVQLEVRENLTIENENDMCADIAAPSAAMFCIVDCNF